MIRVGAVGAVVVVGTVGPVRLLGLLQEINANWTANIQTFMPP